MTLNDLAKEINRTSTDHGFWPNDREDALDALLGIDLDLNKGGTPDVRFSVIRAYIEAQEVRNMGEMLMLAVSELAEGLEAHRDGDPVVWEKHVQTCPWYLGPPLARSDETSCTCTPKPEGLAVELADCIIRCLDTLQSLDVDIDEVVASKMAYNASRPYKHGRAY